VLAAPFVQLKEKKPRKSKMLSASIRLAPRDPKLKDRKEYNNFLQNFEL
jgi:hypothetical protein